MAQEHVVPRAPAPEVEPAAKPRPESEAAAAAAGTEGAGSEGATAETPPDYEALFHESQESLASSTRRADSLQGNLRKETEQRVLGEENARQLVRLGHRSDAVAEHLLSDTPNRAAYDQRLKEIDEETTAASSRGESVRVGVAMLNSINAKIEKAGLSPDDPRLAAAQSKWAEGNPASGNPKLGALHDANDLVDAVLAEIHADEVTKAEAKGKTAGAAGAQATNEAEGAMDLDTGNPTPAGAKPTTKAEADRAYNEGRITSAEYSKWLTP